MMTKCPQLSLYFRPIPCLPYSPLSLYLHRQPNPFSTRKLQKKERKKKGKRQRCAITTAMSFHRRLYSSRLQDAQLTRAERERERSREKERAYRAPETNTRNKGIRGNTLGSPRAADKDGEWSAWREREREDEQRVPRQNYCVRLTNPYRNVCNPPTPACVECVLQSSAPPPRGARCTGWL